MTGSRPGQGEIRSEPDRTAPESEQTQDEGVGSLFGGAQEEILRLFRVKMGSVPRHFSKSERAAAILVLREQMMMHFQALSQRRAQRRCRPVYKTQHQMTAARLGLAT